MASDDVDVIVVNHGSVFTFTPRTPAAQEWVATHLELEDWQRLGTDSFGIDHRHARDIVAGMQEAGLVVA